MIRKKPRGKEELFTKRFYSKNVEREWNRLIKDAYHKLEFETTMRFLRKYLPKRGLILDAGGGPGRYTIELAKKGYRIVLLDLVPANLDFARKKIKEAKVGNKIMDIVEGSIVNLSRFKNNMFDAVICLGGPLSHVGNNKKRKRAVSELVRVAKYGAPIFTSVIGKLSVLQLLTPDSIKEIELTKHHKRIIKRGDDYLWCSGSAGLKGETGYSHYFTLEELKKLFAEQKVKFLENVGLEGLSSQKKDEVNSLYLKHKKAWKNWLYQHYETCTYPSVVDISSHILLIYKKLNIKR